MKDSWIPAIPTKTVISIRIEDSIIERIDKLSEKLSKTQKMSRNELIKQCLVFALERIDTDVNIEK